MRKQTLGLAMATGVILSTLLGGTAFAGSSNHDTPGVPGTEHCVSETTAYLAQAGPTIGISSGIGNLARDAGISVKELKQIIADFCDAR